MLDNDLRRLGGKIGRRTRGNPPPTTAEVVQVQPTPGRVVVQLAGMNDSQVMRYSADFQRSLAELGRDLEGQDVKVSFLESGEPIVDYLIIGSAITDYTYPEGTI